MEEVKNKKCDLCPYATKTNQNLKKHKKIHEKVIPSAFHVKLTLKENSTIELVLMEKLK